MVSEGRGTLRLLVAALWVIVLSLGATALAALAQEDPVTGARDNAADPPATIQDPTEPTEEPAARSVRIPLERQAYNIRILISFSNDAALTARLRADVLRRLQSHAASFVGDAWK